MCEFKIESTLRANTKLYRYMSIESFMAFVETNRINLSNINIWDYKWEAILSKLPTVDDKGVRVERLYSFHQDIYGLCWSLAKESDAMWRIYSPNKTGLQISTSVRKFELIGDVKRWYLGKVKYFKTMKEAFEKIKSFQSPFGNALLKRYAFVHEKEVRFLTHNSVVNPSFQKASYIGLPVNSNLFIESIIVDPRADNWYVEVLRKYCQRIGLNSEPIKSKLYEIDPEYKIGWVKSYKTLS